MESRDTLLVLLHLVVRGQRRRGVGVLLSAPRALPPGSNPPAGLESVYDRSLPLTVD